MMFEPMFLAPTLMVLWLSGMLLIQDLHAFHEAERRIQRVPEHV